MLSDDDILLILANQRKDVPFSILRDFTDAKTQASLNRRVFRSVLLPIAPPLTFFEPSKGKPNEYEISSFFDIPDPAYTIVPFGTKALPEEATQDLGMSYNVFCGGLPIQSYTVCRDATVELPNRKSDQKQYFEEARMNSGIWSAGHLIAHRYTPNFSSPELAATLQLKWNFIPEPYKWNCNQRNHLEARCVSGYYGVYPMYSLRFIHGRTVQPYGKKEKRLPYRPIPDGEFFIGGKSHGETINLFMPFVAQTNKVYDSSVKENVRCKLNVTIEKHKVNPSACPQNITLDFNETIDLVAKEITSSRAAALKLALAQGNLFPENTNEALHQAAVTQFERSATLEFRAPGAKMECALISASLQNLRKTKLFLSATAQHSKFLIDKCEAEEPPVKLFSDRLFSSFKQKFPDETSTLDILTRLKPKFTA